MTADEKRLRQDFGLRLKAAREAVPLTQQQVADKFDVNKGTVSAWETGGGVPDALRLRALAKLYNVSADALLWAHSLTMEALQFAAQYDGLTEGNRRKFKAMWMAYFAEAATDEKVAETIKPNEDGNTEPGQLEEPEVQPKRAGKRPFVFHGQPAMAPAKKGGKA